MCQPKTDTLYSESIAGGERTAEARRRRGDNQCLRDPREGWRRRPADLDIITGLLESDGTVRDVVKVFGGQGTMNVPSWAPDSTQLACVAHPLQAGVSSPAVASDRFPAASHEQLP